MLMPLPLVFALPWQKKSQTQLIHLKNRVPEIPVGNGVMPKLPPFLGSSGVCRHAFPAWLPAGVLALSGLSDVKVFSHRRSASVLRCGRSPMPLAARSARTVTASREDAAAAPPPPSPSELRCPGMGS